jgi:hypothetical protein
MSTEAIGRRSTRARTRRKVLFTVSAVVALTVVVVVAYFTVGGGSRPPRAPFHPENSTQQLAYQTSYASTRQELSEGSDPDSVSRGCRMASYQVQVEQGYDWAIGMLGGCDDALTAE